MSRGQLKEVLSRAERDGWVIQLRRGGHYKLTHPCGAMVFTGSTPSDRRATKNLEGNIRRECTCERK